MTLNEILSEGQQYIQQGELEKALYFYRSALGSLPQYEKEMLEETIAQIEYKISKTKGKKKSSPRTKAKTKQPPPRKQKKPKSPPSDFSFKWFLIGGSISLLFLIPIIIPYLYDKNPEPKPFERKSNVDKTVDRLKLAVETPVPITKTPVPMPKIIAESQKIKQALKLSTEGDALLSQKLYKHSEQKYRESLKLFAMPATLVNLSVIYLRHNQLNKVEELLDKSLEMLKDDKWLKANPEVTLDREAALSKVYINMAFLSSKRIAQLDPYHSASLELDQMVEDIQKNFGYAEDFMKYTTLIKQYDPTIDLQAADVSPKNIKEVKRDIVLSVRAVLIKQAKEQFPGQVNDFDELLALKDHLENPAQRQSAVQILEKAFMLKQLLNRVKAGQL